MKQLLFFLLILFGACATMRESPAAQEDPNIREDSPAIIFVNYTISKNSDKTLIVQFVNKVVAEGSLKKRVQHISDPSIDDLKCIQVSASQVRLDSLIIPNPLVRIMEYVEEDGGLAIKRIELDSAEFSVRMQLNSQTKYVIIEKVNQPNNQLITTKL